MFSFEPGQRWISEMEPELGLGTLMEIDDNQIVVNFDSSHCIRRYALKTAPLKRVKFSKGDYVLTRDNNKHLVTDVTEKNNLFYYICGDKELSEEELSGSMSFTSPKDRLNSGLFDTNKNYQLRYKANIQRYRFEKSEVTGFSGGKIDLIPHQFYIAGAVSKREVPRVLLSDETGLGKTIEACLIVNRLLLSDQIARVLLIVPDSLIHQWFIELYRRFNLSFTIFEENMLLSGENPFTESQTFICGFETIEDRRDVRALMIEAGFDLIVVDEAHHMEEKSNLYRFIGNASGSEKGLILLTATPEQLGEENHFSHLALLDPARYPDFETYLLEKERYRKSAAFIEKLKKDGDEDTLEKELDKTGPGRAVFRNTRETIKGFPKREGILYPLEDELDEDPKLKWLSGLIKKLKGKKAVLICETKDRYDQVDTFLNENMSIKAARFNEEMTILQRDRSAAWFSESDGASLLVCSKIGGEGRNFQFSNHLILMDLAFNPEIIEQRIGRLDRIGQKNKIKIHVPYVKNSPEEVLAKWFKEVGIFEKNISGIHQIHKKAEADIINLMKTAQDKGTIDKANLESLLADTSDFKDAIIKKLRSGKDILLEMNSFRKGPAEKLIDKIIDEDSPELDNFMLSVFEFFDVPYGDTTERTYRLYLDKVDSSFPKPPLRNDEMLVTFDRDTALKRDDIDFLTPDHPMVSNCIDLILGGETGNTAIVKKDGDPGILLEAVYILECVAPPKLQLKRFFPKKPVRIVVDHTINDVTGKFSFEDFERLKIGDKKVLSIPDVKEKILPQMISKCNKLGEAVLKKEIDRAVRRVNKEPLKELERLRDLKLINPEISDEEIAAMENKIKNLKDHILKARVRLDALRVILMQ